MDRMDLFKEISDNFKKVDNKKKLHFKTSSLEGISKEFLENPVNKDFLNKFINSKPIETVRLVAFDTILKRLRACKEDVVKDGLNCVSSGHIMAGDTELCKVENMKIIDGPITNPLAPIYLQRFEDGFINWMRSRSIDRHRANSRLLRKVVRLSDIGDDDLNLDLVLASFARTITDNYWFRPEGVTLSFEDIRFNSDEYSDLALKGDLDSYSAHLDSDFKFNPEFTNIGSYEKCWKLNNGFWYLYKDGKEREHFSELFTYKLGEYFNFDMAKYVLYMDTNFDYYSITKDFTTQVINGEIKEYNLEHIWSLVGEDCEIEVVVEELKKYPNSKELLQQYFNIVFMDLLVRNEDRHCFNFGLLKDQVTGELIKMAPNFDNNITSIARPLLDSSLLRTDLDKINALEISVLKQYGYKIPILTREVVRELLLDILYNFDELVRRKIDIVKIEDFVMNGYNKLYNKLK